MLARLALVSAVVAMVVLALGSIRSLPNARASGSFQVATATNTPTATATATSTATSTATATATSTATATATATSTVAAAAATATPTATAAAAAATATTTATATATSVPLAAYPAPVTSASAVRQGKSLVFRWSLLTQKGVKGFNLYAGKHKLNAHLIKTHRSLSYHARVAYHAGTPAVRVLFRTGQYVTVFP